VPAAILALTWNPQVRGGLYVLIAVSVLCGSGFLLLATNMGARKGFQLAAAGLTGFLVIIGTVWWVYGIGPKGRPNEWKPTSTVTGNPGQGGGVAAGFPSGWKKLELADPAVADALPVADGRLTQGPFKSSSDYKAIGAFEKGGQAYGPLGLNFRPLNVFHKIHYLMVQVQAVIKQEGVPGQAPPKPQVDPSKPIVSVIMVRDLGAKRFNPAVFTISAGLLFGLLCYQLHTKDKETWALQEQGKLPVPV
jgi:hypothetical protein